MRLHELMNEGYMHKNDLNCAESMLWGANHVYSMGISERGLRVASGFGGGMGIEDLCGAASGGLMALGALLTKDRAHAEPEVKEAAVEFLRRFREHFGTLECRAIKDTHRSPTQGCAPVVAKAAAILDEVIEERT
jgi:C_GCAxxG_C_C family probable redox protein